MIILFILNNSFKLLYFRYSPLQRGDIIFHPGLGPPAPQSFNPFIYGNDVDSVDVATRVAMVCFSLID